MVGEVGEVGGEQLGSTLRLLNCCVWRRFSSDFAAKGYSLFKLGRRRCTVKSQRELGALW